MPYDHRNKAGNEGDVVKHVALFAALDRALRRHAGPVFVYSDLFCGPASSPLLAGGEWQRGIGALWTRLGSAGQEHVAGYAAAHMPVEPDPGRAHPGSVSVAVERAAAVGRALRVQAWDVEPRCVESVRSAFADAQVTLGPVEGHIEQAADADLVLFDPPTQASWASAGRPVLEATRGAFLGWLPARIMDRTGPLAEEARALGCAVMRIRYGGERTPSGCVLLLRATPQDADAVWRAVEALCGLVGWHATREV